VEEVTPKSPSLQSQVRWADYRVTVTCGDAREEMERCLQGLLSAEHLPRRRVKEYDLRPLIEDLRIEGKTQRGWLLWMRLRTGSEGTGRPDEVLKELGLYDGAWAIQRERLFFSSGISLPPRTRRALR